MDDLELLWERVEKGEGPDILIVPITNVIRARLNQYEGKLGYWEKFHLAGAIANLTQSRTSCNASYWLRFSLRNIWKAGVPASERDENYTPHDEAIEAFTYEMLLAEVDRAA
ncbi:conserved hypothetical protein [Paraburkholderia tropica]|uniref:hypothetical protein n=1 Tax=Paraburkholderia tropica TaxID=92647 RepID=UPI001CB1932C|nr:hypothetical protein [Paraburkholderia tropica]CAG9239333.1 conserved hypothetical protein [Paraburkholderia tropica]